MGGREAIYEITGKSKSEAGQGAWIQLVAVKVKNTHDVITGPGIREREECEDNQPRGLKPGDRKNWIWAP